ncbi:acylphosphatase [Isoptericola halotolerans]|uniref:acylphosphatase n=1 Tax=Isoptericola halotolerans TaxID=300560 RepID=UPI003890C45F
MSTRVHVIVRGTVQGVGFRWATEQVAREAGAAGWVRNRPDGTVEAVVEGDDATVRRVVDFLRTGPSGAAVAGTDVTTVSPRGEQGFRTR